jgi:hypothetical protein
MTWTRSEIRAARQIPLQPVLEQLGYRLEPRPNDNYAISGQQCGEIVIKDHYWNCPETGQAGNAIDFLMRIRGATFHEAMQQLTQPRRS